jgi:amino acid adenylation domain-containing protein
MTTIKDFELSSTPAMFAQTGYERPVQEWFEMQVRRKPMATALVSVDATLSYQALNEWANQLAARLRKDGVKPNTLVGICIDQRVELVVGLLAVLKAGGAYIPIDPNNPDARIQYILGDTSAHTLLTISPLADRFVSFGLDLICIDDPSAVVQNTSCDLPMLTSMEHLVYCIYTSGSTGKPKGALNLHRGFANLVRWYIGDVGMMPEDRVMITSSIGFDLTQKNIMAPLCVGACVLIPPCSPADASCFLRALSAMAPTWINCAPSAFRTFANSPRTKTIKTVVLGGETIDSALIANLAGRDLRLVNSYGPTECSDVAIWNVWHMGSATETGNMPIGRPIPNVRAHLLDITLKPIAVGDLGEICISGVGVGRGYLARPEMTAEKFIPDPFTPEGGLMYRTGDLGKLRADGAIDFVGRRDFQVKVRGHRIELGEIESCLLSCPSVKAAAVCAHDATPGDTRLVAYLVACDGIAMSFDTLAQILRGTLPDYMVPTDWLQLDILPTTLSGKIDRKALPKPGWAG